MATIQKRGSNQYRVQVRRKGFPAQTQTFCSKQEAVEWATKIESEMIRGVFVATKEIDKTTFGELLQRYLDEITPNKKGAAVETYRIGKLVAHPMSQRVLGSLRSKDFADYRNELKKGGKTPSTIKKEISLISSVYEVARKEWGFEALENPTRHISLDKVRNERSRRLGKQEEIDLSAELQKFSNKTLYPLVVFALETAMRRGEMLSLKWSDIKGRVAHLADTKNGDSRDVPLSPRAMEILVSLPRASDDDLVFPIAERTLAQGFQSCCTKAGIEDFKFHDLRHEATSRLFEKGFGVMEVQVFTGHKTLQMLMRYTHLKAVDLINKL